MFKSNASWGDKDARRMSHDYRDRAGNQDPVRTNRLEGLVGKGRDVTKAINNLHDLELREVRRDYGLPHS